MNAVRLFHWIACDPQGRFHHGTLAAINRKHIDQLLQKQRLYPVKIHQPWLRSRLDKKKLNHSVFFLQLSQLLHAGFPLSEALDLLSKTTPILIWRILLQQINLQIRDGQLLSTSLKQWSTIFSPFSVALITVGEATGQLDRCCQHIADLYQQHNQIHQAIIKAIRYPLLVLILTCLIVLVIISVILPQFSELYSSLNAPLPFITQTLIRGSTFLIWGVPLVASLLSLLPTLSRYCYQHHHAFRVWISVLIAPLPILGKAWQAAMLSKLFNLLAITQHAGISLQVSLEMAALSVQCPLWKVQISLLKQRIQGGATVAKAISSFDCFPSLCHSLLYPAEKSGDLQQGFQQIGQWYQRHFIQSCDKLILWLQPIIMLIAGLITGGLLFAIYLPILQLATYLN